MAKITKEYNSMGLPMNINRSNAIPIDNTELWYSLEDAQNYALSGATSYVGQSIKVIDEATGDVTCYVIGMDGSLIDQSSVDVTEHDHDGVYVPVDTFNDLVGNVKVEDQIKNQLKDIQIEKEIYIQNDEPTDAADGTVWIDVDADPVQTGNVVSIPAVTTEDNGKIMMVVNGRWEAVMVSNGEGVVF